MTNQEFYENHFLVEGKKPPPLTKWQKELFAIIEESAKNPAILSVQLTKGRRTTFSLYFNTVAEKLKYEQSVLPTFLQKPNDNQ